MGLKGILCFAYRIDAYIWAQPRMHIRRMLSFEIDGLVLGELYKQLLQRGLRHGVLGDS